MTALMTALMYISLMTALSKFKLMLSLMKFTLMTTIIVFVQTVHNSLKGNISINPSQWLVEVLQQ
jgi:hypothetical protein